MLILMTNSLRLVSTVLLGTSKIKLLLPGINFIVGNDCPDNLPHVVLKHHALKQSRNTIQLGVCRFIVPTHGRHGVLRLKEVGHGRIIYNYDVFHGTAQSCQIFDISTVEESAVLAEKQVRAHLLRVKVFHQRLCIL